MASSSGFPLLKLPLLAFENVINVMDPDVILDLAFLSKRFKSCLSFVKWKVDSFEWAITQNQIGVTINLFRSWNIRIQPNCAWKSEPRNLNGTMVPLARYDCPFGGTIWYLALGDFAPLASMLAMLEHLTEFLMSFVKCSRFKLDYSLGHNLLSKDFFIWKHVPEKSIDLSISGVQGYPLEMSSEVLRFILEDVKFDKLSLDVDVTDKDFKFEGPLETKHLSIGNSKWIDLKRARLDCEKMVAGYEPEELNQILHNWSKGLSLGKLEALKIHKSTNPTIALEGIQNWSSRFSAAHIMRRIGRFIGTSECRDIRRESDGRWGTVIMNPVMVDFIVWKSEDLNA